MPLIPSSRSLPKTVTQKHIDSLVAATHYTTGAQAARSGAKTSDVKIDPALERLTLCFLVLRSGYVVVGQSACLVAEKFDAEAGRVAARADAMRQLSQLEAYVFRTAIGFAEKVERVEEALVSKVFDFLADAASFRPEDDSAATGDAAASGPVMHATLRQEKASASTATAPDRAAEGLKYHHAAMELRSNKVVTRADWKGRGVLVFRRGRTQLRTPDGYEQDWTPTQQDIDAGDWAVIGHASSLPGVNAYATESTQPQR